MGLKGSRRNLKVCFWGCRGAGLLCLKSVEGLVLTTCRWGWLVKRKDGELDIVTTKVCCGPVMLG